MKMLTPREMQVMRELATGDTGDVVAERLGIHRQTLKNHCSAVYEKLQVGSLVGAFRALGWLKPR